MFAYVLPANFTLNSAAVNLGGNTTMANLFCIYLTPKENTMIDISSESVYQYNDYTIFTNSIAGSVAPHTDLVNVVNFTESTPENIGVRAHVQWQSPVQHPR